MGKARSRPKAESAELRQMHAELDANPADWALRSILADWYADHDEAELARLQRWLAANEKHPECKVFSSDRPYWMWHNHPKAGGVLTNMVEYRGFSDCYFCGSRREAEESLLPHLDELEGRQGG